MHSLTLDVVLTTAQVKYVVRPIVQLKDVAGPNVQAKNEEKDVFQPIVQLKFVAWPNVQVKNVVRTTVKVKDVFQPLVRWNI